ncbi:MAG: hypothetical protein R3Y64_07985 [Peptostreptococcaceae bacterium]
MGALKKKNNKQNVLIELEHTKIFKLTNARYVEEAEEFINLIHKNNTGMYAFLTKDKGEHQYFQTNINYNLLMNYLSLKDLYISINSFFIPLRQSKAIRQLNAFWIDLDYYKEDKYKNKTTQEMIRIMRSDGKFELLEPSLFVDSGNGLYIFWLIEDAPKHAIKIWQYIENKLVDHFVSYGADQGAKDPVRVLRIPGSINSKTGRRATIISNKAHIRYRLSDIKDKILPELPYSKEEWLKIKEERKKVKQESKNNIRKNNKVRHLRTIRNLNYSRMLDIEKLIDIRNGELQGYRNYAIYMYTLFNLYTNGEMDELERYIERINNKLTEPLTNKNIKDIIKTAKVAYCRYLDSMNTYKDGTSIIHHLRSNGCIIYSNNGIIRRLEITEEEMQKMKTIIDKDEKYNRKLIRDRSRYYKKIKSQGKLTKKEQLEQIYEQIKNLQEEGFKQVDIAIQLNVGERTVKRHISSMKKNGLI